MRFASTALLFAALAATPAFCQNSSTSFVSTTSASNGTALPVDASNASVDYVALRDNVSRQNKVLVDQLNVTRAIFKKNQELLKDAQKINASNLKLADEKKKIEAQSAELQKQRESLKSSQKPAEVASN